MLRVPEGGPVAFQGQVFRHSTARVKHSRQTPSFTIFTPAYNAEKTIDRVYGSLKNQTVKDFEWIAIDDGSSDATLLALYGFAETAPFPVVVESFQVNRGKPAAHNRAVELARGRYFLILDADDGMISTAIAELLEAFEKIEAPSVAGITVHCRTPSGERIGDEFPQDGYKGTFFDLHFRLGVRGEKWTAFITDVLRKYPFNTTIDRFVPETTVWYAISSSYYFVHLNRALRIYFEDDRPERLSVGASWKHPRGRAWAEAQFINEFRKEVHLSAGALFHRLKRYWRWGFHAGWSVSGLLSRLSEGRIRLFAICALPFGARLYFKDLLGGRRNR